MKRKVLNSTEENMQKCISFEDSFKQLEDIAASLSNILDSTSAQIAKIEDRLRSLKTNFPCHMVTFESQDSMYKPLEEYHSKCVGPFESLHENYYMQTRWLLAWDVDEHSKSYRLLTIVENVDLGWVHVPEREYPVRIELRNKILSKKPLVESKLEIRLRYSKFLVPFINFFKKSLDAYSVSIKNNDLLKPDKINDDSFQKFSNSSGSTFESSLEKTLQLAAVELKKNLAKRKESSVEVATVVEKPVETTIRTGTISRGGDPLVENIKDVNRSKVLIK